ncbi:beta-glucosidase [Marchantia polymorpha subsp. ruderalis]|uniref:beta-glucosidase n=2 Tax=Marchantia polymorpha TaxID=3197 RepID=A0A176WE76_MARPO|nr:hypothetical protein AXG93_725s1160 [Marchantia polymorpha subsp. ruderalis]PTQ27193.1 hypothetical protein MARPO_0214s0014 [Marchantia polymorpha]BBN08676.1 hypothetical protein Mp_4g13480 [Marchantia polymorpha subsp. ruderalis]|eukprot:PTQ27193.1 hypothetical protein MARPO_0214s0014 [Marchantia polymorpha]
MVVATIAPPELGRNRRWIVSAIVIVVMVSVALNGEGALAQQPLYKDASQPVELRVQDLLSRMTVQEKIGQMTQIERTVATPEVMTQYFIGSVLSGGGSAPEPNAPAAWQDMIDTMQQAALATRLAIPMIYGIDAVHGHNNLYGATVFPHNIGLGCSRDPDLVKRIGAATALEVRATGIPYAFAPCIATCRDPRWGRCYESYSEDTAVVKTMTDIILGLQGDPPNLTAGVPFMADKSKVIGCAKHYVGDGGTFKGINENDTIVDYDTLYKVHMAPYLDAIAKGVSTIMVSYSSWNGERMHANQYLVTQVLKEQLAFRGFIISDWMGVDRLSDPNNPNYTNSVLKSINAGLDMIMVPFDYEAYISGMLSLVNDGEISMERIDDAVTRILRVKFVMGLFEDPSVDRSLTNHLGSQEHRILAREAVRKSLVLLKNGQQGSQALLPLKKNATSILVAGSHADDIGLQCGGWTISWVGAAGNTTIGTTVLDAIKAAVSPTTVVTYEKNPAPGFAAQLKPDYAIVVVGEEPYVETYGDNMELTIPLDGIPTIQNVCAEVKCLVIVISGRPLVIEPYMPQIDALVAAWLPGSEGQGISDVIFGDYDFVGKLSRTWFRTVDQLPMNFGDAVYDPLFPFDFGLTMGTKESL